MEDIIMIWKPEAGDNLDLKPCPFCGSEEIMYIQYNHIAGKRWRVQCAHCVAGIDPGYAQIRHVVRDMWNRRA